MKRVLLISPGNTKVAMTYLLRDEGYQVDYAPTQEDYEKLVSSGECAGVLIGDLRVPGESTSVEEPCQSGFEVIEDATRRGIPVLAVSGEGSQYVEKKAEDLGAKVLTMQVVQFEKIFTEFKKLTG